MPLPFSLPQRPVLPSLSWSTNTSPKPDSEDDPSTPTQTPHSAPPRPSHSSNASISLSKRLSARSIRHTSLVVSRPTTPAKYSPLSAAFGLPVDEDDDPFGVLALEKAGLQIKEAGTKENHRPGSEAFQYRPSPNSPVWRSSMASAVSKNSRPSLDGRASITTGRPSTTHSRQSSVSEIGTQTDDRLDGGSLRGISPIREASQSRNTSPESARKVSPTRPRKSTLGNGRPPPLKLQQTNGDRRRNEEPSPRTRLSAVQEKVREIELEQKAREARVKEEEANTPKEESDLDRLAREIREMAYEHEEAERRSEEEARQSEEQTRKSEEPAHSTTGSETIAKDDKDNLSSESISTAVDSESEAVTPRSSQLPRRESKQSSKRRSTLVADTRVLAMETNAKQSIPEDKTMSEADNDEEEEEDDDDDDDDYDSFDDEEPIIIEAAVQSAAPVQLRPRHMTVQSLQARAQIVSVHLPPPPAIPSRNPRRARNSEVSEDQSPTLGSPATHEEAEPVAMPTSVTPESGPVGSKAESIRSIRDNDTNSSYSLDGQRDSFADANHDIMSQTSHGSEPNDVIETTPTKTKPVSPDFANIAEHVMVSTDQPVESSLEDSIAIANVAHDILEETGEAPVDRIQADLKDTVTSQTSEEITDVPEIPARRRPFSFEAAACDESARNPGIQATMESSNETKATAEERPESKETEKKAAEKEANENPKTTVQPIVIPQLSDDDHSEYEEDFS